MKRWWKWIVAAVVVLLVAGLAARVLSARKAQQQAQAQAAAAKSVTVVELAATDTTRAQIRELEQGLPVTGALKAVTTAFVKARVPGELQGLTVREGDAVKAGQVVARIEPTEYQARLRQAQDQANAAKVQIDIAQRQFDNNRALMEKGFISKTALDTSAFNLSGAQASYQAALAAADVARKTLADTVLVAPINGLVSQRLAQPGERVPVDGRIIEIVDLSRVELEAAVSASDAPRVRVGQNAVLKIRHVVHPRLHRQPGDGHHGHAGLRGAGPVQLPAAVGRPVPQHRLPHRGGADGLPRRQRPRSSRPRSPRRSRRRSTPSPASTAVLAQLRGQLGGHRPVQPRHRRPQGRRRRAREGGADQARCCATRSRTRASRASTRPASRSSTWPCCRPTAAAAPQELTTWADQVLQKRLENVRGVGSVTRHRRRAARDQHLPEPAGAGGLGVTIDQVVAALRSENQELPLGACARAEQERVVQINARMKRPRTSATSSWRAATGVPVKLWQVADVVGRPAGWRAWRCTTASARCCCRCRRARARTPSPWSTA
jgi:pyruvate/2-oxoglutarate dehydrogenase complex dihydrolipoamide acyltransferase (E2) component